MNTYEVIIHYVIPSRLGGIQSATQRLIIHDKTEELAEKSGIITGVNDANYLYTNMVETKRIYN